jgi:hypothetical protein
VGLTSSTVYVGNDPELAVYRRVDLQPASAPQFSKPGHRGQINSIAFHPVNWYRQCIEYAALIA